MVGVPLRLKADHVGGASLQTVFQAGRQYIITTLMSINLLSISATCNKYSDFTLFHLNFPLHAIHKQPFLNRISNRCVESSVPVADDIICLLIALPRDELIRGDRFFGLIESRRIKVPDCFQTLLLIHLECSPFWQNRFIPFLKPLHKLKRFIHS